MGYLFETDDDAVLIGQPSQLDNIFAGGAAITWWMRLNSFGIGTLFGRVANKASSTGTDDGWAIQVNGSLAPVDSIRFARSFSTSDGTWQTPSASLLIGVWYHCAVIYNDITSSNDPIIMINGVVQTLDETTTPLGTPTTDAAQDLLLGNFFDLNRTFDGDLSDIRFFSGTIPTSLVQTIYASQGADAHVDHLARWPMYGVPGRTPSNLFKDSTTNEIGAAGAITSTVPTKQVDGDKLIMIVASSGDGSGVAENMFEPEGWTHVNVGATDAPATVSTPSVWVYERNSGASEPATYVVSGNQTTTKIVHMLAVENLGDVDVSGTLNTGTSADPLSPSVTAAGNAYCLRIAITDDDEVQAASVHEFVPPGINGREVDEDTGTGNGVSLGTADEMVSAGATGTRTWNPVASEEWAALTITWDGGDGLEPAAVRDTGPFGFNGDVYGSPVVAPDQLKRRRRNS